MTKNLSAEKAKQLLDEVLASFPHEECHTCECFLGYLTQLEMDSSEQLSEVFSSYKPERMWIHSCLGCDTCPPADLFGDYLSR